MFYDNFIVLCKKKSVAPTRVALDIGLSNSAPIKWRSGAIPNGDGLQKLADYFGVTTDYLLTGAETKKAPTDGARQASDDDIKFALFGGDGEITDAMYDEVKRFAQMVKLREEAEREKK